MRNYIKYIDYLLIILKCQYTICMCLWELSRDEFTFICVKVFVLQNTYLTSIPFYFYKEGVSCM